jgi:hypothetical protein
MESSKLLGSLLFALPESHFVSFYFTCFRNNEHDSSIALCLLWLIRFYHRILVDFGFGIWNWKPFWYHLSSSVHVARKGIQYWPTSLNNPQINAQTDSSHSRPYPPLSLWPHPNLRLANQASHLPLPSLTQSLRLALGRNSLCT